MISDFVLNDTITAFLSIRKMELREYGGNNFITFEFGDATGRIAGVWWEPEPSAQEELKEGDIAKVKGVVGDYKGKPQLKVAKIRLAKDDEYDLAEILPRSRYSKEELKGKIISLTERVENGHIRR